jgi:hypothetical protein
MDCTTDELYNGWIFTTDGFYNGDIL